MSVWNMSREVSNQISKSIADAVWSGDFDHLITRRVREYVKDKVSLEVSKKLKSLDLNKIVSDVLIEENLHFSDKIQKTILQLAAENISLTMNEVKFEIQKKRIGESKKR